jgi:hypothetical protein
VSFWYRSFRWQPLSRSSPSNPFFFLSRAARIYACLRIDMLFSFKNDQTRPELPALPQAPSTTSSPQKATRMSARS